MASFDREEKGGSVTFTRKWGMKHHLKIALFKGLPYLHVTNLESGRGITISKMEYTELMDMSVDIFKRMKELEWTIQEELDAAAILIDSEEEAEKDLLSALESVVKSDAKKKNVEQMTCWSKHGDIFGSPPEPHFNHKGSGVSPELLQEWLLIIADKNAQRITNLHKGSGLYKMHNAAEFVFLTCEKLKMPPHAKYLSIEIFDRKAVLGKGLTEKLSESVLKKDCKVKTEFMLKHIRDLYKHALESQKKLKWKYWLDLQDRIKNQLLLRIISCCQIASKLTSHYKVVGINRTRRFLAESGHHYTSDSILQSEMRVLKTLEFNVLTPTALTYIELLLEILGHNDPETNVKLFYEVTTKVLDMVYFNYNDVYKRLYQFASCKHAISFNDSDKISCVKADYMLLSVAIITTSCYIVDQPRADSIIEQLSKITRVPTDDIIDFATVLVQVIMENN